MGEVSGKVDLEQLRALSRKMTHEQKLKDLVRRKYPFVRPQKVGLPSGVKTDTSRIEAAYEYEKTLRAKSPQELDALYEEQMIKEIHAQHAKLEQEEKERFFNRPHAKADFDHWAKMPYWKLDEAVALTFGKNPKVVNWPSIEKLKFLSPFAKQYDRVRELAERAKVCKQLSDPTYPSAFIAWANLNEIQIPPELQEQVSKRSKAVTDWKRDYQELAESAKKAIAQANATAELHQGTAEKLRSENVSIRAELKVLQSRCEQPSGRDKTAALSGKRRTSALKIILGVAMEQYGFDPHTKRSTVARDIASDLALHGLSIDEDTVRNWLREAVDELGDCLPPDDR